MERTIQLTKNVTICDACGNIVHEQRNSSEKVKRFINEQGKIMTNVDVCEDCFEEGLYRYCEKCETLVHDDYAFEGVDRGTYYCVDCADIVLKQLEDMRIRYALERNRLLATMTE